jgi:hypothetical protein
MPSDPPINPTPIIVTCVKCGVILQAGSRPSLHPESFKL